MRKSLFNVLVKQSSSGLPTEEFVTVVCELVVFRVSVGRCANLMFRL